MTRLSQSQLGIYYACQDLDGHSGDYQVPFLYKLPDTTDLERLRNALEAVEKAHPYILSGITLKDGEPLTVPGTPGPVSITDIEEIREEELTRTANLLTDPLVRFEIYRTKNGNYLLTDFHHIIYDASSFRIFVEDLRKAYDGEELQAEEIDGAAIADAEETLRKSEQWQIQRDWYLKEFSQAQDTDSEPVHCFTQGNKGTVETDFNLQLSKESVNTVCKKFGAKKSTVLTAAWAKLLANYTAEDKAYFATIFNGRTVPGCERAITMMVRTLPVFSFMPSSKTISQWLEELSTQQEKTRKMDAYSFADIHQDLDLRGDIMFAYQGKIADASGFLIRLGNDTISSRDLRKARPGVTLDAQLFDTGSGYILRISYDSGTYTPSVIEAMASSYSAIVGSMQTAETIGDLEAVTDAQARWLDSQNPETPEVPFKPVIEQFRERAKANPGGECCVFNDRRYTYGQIDRITDHLASQIQKRAGQQPTIPVISFICPRSEWMVIMPLAIAKTGFTYQPLDASYPKERLEYMVKDAKASLVICTPEFHGLVSAPELIVNQPETGEKPEAAEIHESDLFNLLYTSGTTGTPKGVCISQDNICVLASFAIRQLELGIESRLATYASYGFDAYMLDLWTAMTSGGSLHVISEDIRYDLEEIYKYFNREKITNSIMTTQVGTQMAINFPDIPSLKTMGVGGEKLVTFNPPEYKFWNMYGPTECTTYLSSYLIEKDRQSFPIGRPNESIHCYVVNKDGKRVPVGAAGELWAAGRQIGLGYLGLPEKTAQVFIDNPFEDGCYSHIYRTGDIVRYLESGELDFVGRKDGQVKIRGFRIEIKEVEAVIRDFPGINEVTVHAFELEDGGKALAAYLVSEDKIDINGLKAFIGERKPPYMVPAVIMQIDAIPLNVNGKVDKKRLPKPQIQIEETVAGPAAPLNTLEQSLKELISKAVDCSDFTITTPLSYLGLTSISSLKLSAQILKEYGISVSVKDLTHGETLQSIENRILEKLLSKTAERQAVKQEEPALLSAPLTGSQLGVYLECLKDSSSTVYNIPNIITFPKSVTPARIKDALERVILAHPSFFITIDNSVQPPVQRIPENPRPELTVSELPADELKRDFVQPFNLSEGPLYRAVIAGNVLLLDVHHLVMDGASVSIVLHQICDLLEGRTIGKEDCTWMDHSDRERKRDFSASESFFSGLLSKIDGASSIPADLRSEEKSGRQAEAVLPVDHEAVCKLARSLGVTPAAVYLSALEYLTARYCNSRDACICTVSSGRSDLRTGRTVGMFVNTLALTSTVGEGTVGDYIRGNAATLSSALENENYPFAKVAAKFDIAPDVMYVYQIGLIDSFSVDSQPVKLETLELSAPKSKFSLLVEERSGRVALVAQYNDALYSRGMVRRFLDSLGACLANMKLAPDAPVRSLSIVSAAQRGEVEGMHHGPVVPMPVRMFHKGIQRWISDRIAVIATDATLSYRELEIESNRVANALLQHGLKRSDAVVVLLPRRSTTISCIVGILKAGGAFIPCDPEYPTERIRLIAEDSGAPFVVTTDELVGDYPGRGLSVSSLLQCADTADPDLDLRPEDLAYMIYTSGSTGRPKGVRVSHGNITTCLTVTPESAYWPVVHDCGLTCCVTTISFDAFIIQFGMSLFNGKCFIFASEEEAKDPIELVKLFRRTGANHFCCTSSRMIQYLELPEFVDCMRSCGSFVQGGEKFPEALLKRLKEINPGMAIINGYGPTEISINCNSVDLRNSDWISVGRPSPNYTEWILDVDGNELPVGIVGELCVGGPGVTQGYNNLPELTAQKYITYDGMRAFKTGDFARWHDNGEIEILGRTDNQVKLRGLRIELGEVESAIAKVEGVKNVLVRICNIQGRDHLSAYFTADRTIDIAEMKKAIGGTLTVYMVPDAYLQMEELPLTPNGKVDFKHLPEPVLAKNESEYVRPSGKEEVFFADTFAKILGVDKVGATDSFFDLGGTSLVVMKLVILAQQGGYRVTYGEVFENPTPRQLARLVRNGGGTETDPDADIRDFDYTEIDKVLKTNVLDTFRNDNSLRPLGNVLLTGATGFLGIHVFDCLLRHCPDSRIHCLLRSKRGVSAKERLAQMMFYYFERDCSSEFGKRVFVYEGDVTAPLEIDAPIDTVINCAALVKHFAKGSEIEDVNVGGVRNCVEFCLKRKARLVQISTYSVAGTSVNGQPDVESFKESMLFFGQTIHNQYVHSKIMGERLILDAVARKGLDAKIMRVGNLSARSRDGEFQINVKANSFMGRLRIYQMLGALPYSAFSSPVEFSPIDQTAAAICLLAGTNSSCTVFHPYNIHGQLLGDIINRMDIIGKSVSLVEDGEFMEILSKAKQDESLQEKLSAMLAYENRPGKDFTRVIPPDNSFTLQVLLRLGFRWNATSRDYVDQFLRQIDGLKFFERSR